MQLLKWAGVLGMDPNAFCTWCLQSSSLENAENCIAVQLNRRFTFCTFDISRVAGFSPHVSTFLFSATRLRALSFSLWLTCQLVPALSKRKLVAVTIMRRVLRLWLQVDVTNDSSISAAFVVWCVPSIDLHRHRHLNDTKCYHHCNWKISHCWWIWSKHGSMKIDI